MRLLGQFLSKCCFELHLNTSDVFMLSGYQTAVSAVGVISQISFFLIIADHGQQWYQSSAV
ncbi:hypothetical protein OH492_05020 [Vibrio chagasii]|nr:hypothetical protein [Vibrio chagasii]